MGAARRPPTQPLHPCSHGRPRKVNTNLSCEHMLRFAWPTGTALLTSMPTVRCFATSCACSPDALHGPLHPGGDATAALRHAQRLGNVCYIPCSSVCMMTSTSQGCVTRLVQTERRTTPNSIRILLSSMCRYAVTARRSAIRLLTGNQGGRMPLPTANVGNAVRHQGDDLDGVATDNCLPVFPRAGGLHHGHHEISCGTSTRMAQDCSANRS